jgi:hypothetical protein
MASMPVLPSGRRAQCRRFPARTGRLLWSISSKRTTALSRSSRQASPTTRVPNAFMKRVHKIRIRMCSGRLGLVSTSRRQIRFVKTRHPRGLGSPREITDQR